MNGSRSTKGLACRDVLPLRDAYADGALGGELRSDVERHLRVCARCADAVRRSERERASIVASLAEASMHRSVVEDVIRQLKKQRRVRVLYRVAYAVAASVIVAVGAWMWRTGFSQRGQEPSNIARAESTFGKVVDVAGVVRAGTEYVQTGQSVALDKALTTQDDAHVKIRSRWGDEILVGENARLKFSADNERRVVLEKGEVFCRVERSVHGFAVACPQGEVRVEGTVFDVSTTGEGMTAFLAKGKIRLLPQTGSPKNLAEGERVVLNSKGRIVSLQRIGGGDLLALNQRLACCGERPIGQSENKVWLYGRVATEEGKPARDAVVRVVLGPGPKIPKGKKYVQRVDDQGRFVFMNRAPGTYVLAVEINGNRRSLTDPPLNASIPNTGYRCNITLPQ